MSILISSELKEAIELGRVSLGCPLPEGFKPMTQDDRYRLQEAMRRIVEMENNLK